MAFYHVLAFMHDTKGFVSAEDAGSEDNDRMTKVSLEMDALVSEAPEYGATPTKNAVERGADVTDHVALNPVSLNIEGVISNTPTSLLKIASGTTLKTKKPADEGYAFLKKLWQQRRPFNFVGGWEMYQNMVIVSLSVPRRAASGDALMFSCRMQQLNLVESTEITIEKVAKKDAPKAVPVQDVGFQPAGTFQSVQKTAKVGGSKQDLADFQKFTSQGGSYPLTGLTVVP